jgi:hypothetical protein
MYKATTVHTATTAASHPHTSLPHLHNLPKHLIKLAESFSADSLAPLPAHRLLVSIIDTYHLVQLPCPTCHTL